MKKPLKIVGLVVAIAAVVLILSQLGLFKSTKNDGNNNNQQQQENSNGLLISISNFTFTPATLTINKGETVTWTNNDSTSHDIVGDTFKSALLKKGETFSFTFNTAGTFEYTCGIHPSMTGTVVVK